VGSRAGLDDLDKRKISASVGIPAFSQVTVPTAVMSICAKNQQMHRLLNLLIMYGSSYMFRNYIAILRERS
jgi:hypothetical protein